MNSFHHFSQAEHLTNINHNNSTHISIINTSSTPLKRTRAKRSCDFCRKRKSRCDADACTPCSNCKAWGYTCEFQTIRKKRGPPSVYVDNLEKKCKKMESLLTALTNCSIAHLERNDFQYAGHRKSNSQPVQTDSSSDEYEDTDFDTQEDKNFKNYDSIKYTGQSSTGLKLFDKAFKDQPSISWPGRENIVLKLIAQDELMIVRTEKSAMANKPDTLLDVGLSMRIPSGRLKRERTTLKSAIKSTTRQLNEIIGIYFSHLHVSFPIINKAKFLKQYNSSSTKNFILTQSVIALTFRFVSQNLPGLVEEAEELGEKYFRKVMRLLRDSTRSRLCFVQSALLMVLYLDMDKDDVESVQWCTLGTAIRMAQDLGLHRSCKNWDLPRSEIETRHRVFYSCYIMDRWLGARAGKPLTILDRDFDTTIPSPFEISDNSNEGLPIYQSFLLLIELSEILGRVLKALYAPDAKNANLDAALDDPTILSVLTRRLKNWKDLLDKSTDGNCLKKIDNLNLKLYYYTVILLLHRPFSSLPTDKYAQSPSIVSESEKICLDAAKKLGEIVTRRKNETNNPSYYVVFCSPTCFIYSLFQSSMVFLFYALKTKCSSDIQLFYQSIHLIKIHSYMGPASQAIEIINMLAAINGLYTDGSDLDRIALERKNNSCPTVHLTDSAPNQAMAQFCRPANDIFTSTQAFHEQLSHNSSEHTNFGRPMQKLSNPQLVNCGQYGSQYQSLQHPHVTQTHYAQAYSVYNNAYSHQRSFSSDQLNTSQQTYSQHHSRSISYDQLEMITSRSSSSRVDLKSGVDLSGNVMDNACYMSQTRNSNNCQHAIPINSQHSQTYNPPHDSNLNISSTNLPTSDPHWADWNVYLENQSSSQQR